MRDRTRQVLGRGGVCNECEWVQRMRLCNECERGATNAEWGCNKCKTGATNAKTGATNADSNGCFTRCNKCDATNATTGATDARSGVRELCLGRGVRVTRIRSGGVRECYAGLITCWKTGGAARNGPNECIEGVSKGTTRLN